MLEEVRHITARRGVDVVLDHVGAATWETSGTWVGTKAEMPEIMRLIERRRLAPVVYAVLPLEAAAAAHRMEESRHFGKIVLQVP